VLLGTILGPNYRGRIETDGTGKRMKRIAIAGRSARAASIGLQRHQGLGLQSRGELKPGSKPCGTFNLAITSWVGYEANAAVIT